MRKYVHWFVYYLLPVLMLGIPLVFPSPWLYAKIGTAALVMLTTVLYVKPLSVLTPYKIFKILMGYRREMGLASFWLYVGHAWGFISTGFYGPDMIFNLNGFIFWGWLAGVLLWIMAFTSNNFAVKLLRRNWKRVQRLAYVIYFLVLYHSSQAEGEWTKLVVLGGIYLLLKMLEVWSVQRRRKVAIARAQTAKASLENNMAESNASDSARN